MNNSSSVGSSYTLKNGNTGSLTGVEGEASGVTSQLNKESGLIERSAFTPKHKEHLYLTWNSVNVYAAATGIKGTCFYNNEKRFKQILYDLTGYAHPGKLTLLLGPSGSGKTTMLNFLADLLSRNLKFTGNVLINGRKHNVKKYSAYIQQTDLFFNLMTVREHLEFHAFLRMNKKMNREERMEKIDELLRDFDLFDKQKNLLNDFGQASKGLSGGERRRLTIITELLKDPKIIFADEPTSGLDSFLAENIIFILKKYAMKGKTIVCTVHQPSSEAFELFDDVCMLSKGKSIYMGSVRDAPNFFKDIGYPVPLKYNPADHYINIMSMLRDQENDDATSKILDTISRSSKESLVQHSTSDFIDLTHEKKDKFFNAKYFFGQYQSAFYVQFKYLFLRSIKSYVRNTQMLVSRILQDVVLAIILGLVYLQLPYTLSNLILYAGIFFLESVGLSLNATLAAVTTFPQELNIYNREHHNHIYRSSMYFIAKTLGELPIQIMHNTAFMIIFYFLVGLYLDAETFFLHYAFVLLTYQAALSYGYFISALAGDALVAAAMSTPMLIPLMTFGGFLLRNDGLPTYLHWVKYVSWFNYAFEGLLIVNYKNTEITCNVNPICRMLRLIGLRTIPGQLLLFVLGIRVSDLAFNYWGMVILGVCYRILGIIIIIMRVNISSRIQPI